MRVSKVMVADVTFVADLSGALFWQEQRLLVVSDLHLEKAPVLPRAACCCRPMTPWRR